tara:strand:+ start:499 stop:1191 length:693 start_codon:yes stop_codon:yes gene_type:complete
LVLAVSITIGQIGIGRQNSRYGTRAPQGGVSLSRFVRLEKRVATLETELELVKKTLGLPHKTDEISLWKQRQAKLGIPENAVTLANDIIIYDLVISTVARNPALSGQIKNIGSQPIKILTATLYFLDENGQRIFEEQITGCPGGGSAFKVGYSSKITFPLWNAPKEWAADGGKLTEAASLGPRRYGGIITRKATFDERITGKVVKIAEPPSVSLDEYFLEFEVTDVVYAK